MATDRPTVGRSILGDWKALEASLEQRGIIPDENVRNALRGVFCCGVIAATYQAQHRCWDLSTQAQAFLEVLREQASSIGDTGDVQP